MNATREGWQTAMAYLNTYAQDGNYAHAAYQADVQLEAIRPYTARNLSEAARILRWIAAKPEPRLANARAFLASLETDSPGR